MKTVWTIRLILIGIGIVLLTFVYFAGRWAQKVSQEKEQAVARAKLFEIQAKQWQDSTRLFKDNAKRLLREVSALSRENDSLVQQRIIRVTRIIHMPVTKYQSHQLDSIWRDAYKDQ